MTRATSVFVLRSAVVAMAILLASDACSDATRPGDGGGGGGALGEKIRAGTVVSGPLGALDGVSASGPTPDSELVYISMPPGTLDGGDSVRIGPANRITASASAPMGAGGFDPVSLYARVGDSLDIAIFTHSVRTTARVGVPPMRRPSVIRTTPARGRTDVPLNQEIVIVFSQPVSASTVTSSSIRLTHGDVTVPATVTLRQGQPWVVQLSPSSALAPNTTYQLVIGSAIRDVNGLVLAAPVTTSFVTGTASGEIASIVVSVVDWRGFTQGSIASAVPGGTAEFVADRLSVGGDTLSSRTGTPYVWSSSDPAVATVLNTSEYDDTVTAVAPGQATIQACAGTICGHGTIVVNAPEPGIVPTELGDLGGGFSRVDDMAGGYVVGSSSVPYDPNTGFVNRHAFLWSASRGMEDLGTLPGERESFAQEVNASGTVVGYGVDTLGKAVPWIWTRATGMQPLPSPDTARADWGPFELDSHGTVAFSDSTGAIWLWNATTGGRAIALAPGMGAAGGMNDLGQLTILTSQPHVCDQSGSCSPSCGTTAYVWDAALGRAISTLAPRDSVTGEALAICPWQINNQGVVSGSVSANVISAGNWGVNQTAFRWTPSGGFAYFPAGPGVGSESFRLNDAGDATVYLFSWRHVGQDSVYDIRSVVWMANGDVTSLGSLGGLKTAANGINDSHLVAGHSQLGSNTGQQHAVIWDLSTAAASKVQAARSSSATGKRSPARGARAPLVR